ncbi:hypothetical protein QYE76_002940 [Lolium multiflorum]|uniref:CCHC-type domain-containing protein n=1 Tax=Lolium multiflorum TaxID=4521 RepID=A0AAD8RNF9_LOLMU|nr:hypothetical protein QYE76_002940 [Lolium multiflorum]
MPGAMPPPWFGGPFPPYPQQPFGMQPNQWVNPQQNGGQGQQATGEYGDTICEGCGEPGHLKAACSKGACCFICKASNHAVDDCPVLRRPHQIARLFNFHGKLFQLQFTAELPNATGVQREVLAGKDSGNAVGGNGNGTSRMDTDGRSEANRNTTNSQSSGGSNHQVETGNASHGRQTAMLTADTSEEVIPGSEVYKLLMEKGAIGTDGQFIWDAASNADEGVRS